MACAQAAVAPPARPTCFIPTLQQSHPTLGWDSDYPWAPNDEEQAEWDRFRSHSSDQLPPLQDYIVDFLSPLRRVRIEPFLLEVTATPLGVHPLTPDDPLFEPRVGEELI